MPEPAVTSIVFRIRNLVTEYLVRESPELWKDRDDLGGWTAVPFPSLDEAWNKARALSTPEQRVHAVPRPARNLEALRHPTAQNPQRRRPFDPNWRDRVKNVGGQD